MLSAILYAQRLDISRHRVYDLTELILARVFASISTDTRIVHNNETATVAAAAVSSSAVDLVKNNNNDIFTITVSQTDACMHVDSPIIDG
jgi:hypothetical protein